MGTQLGVELLIKRQLLEVVTGEDKKRMFKLVPKKKKQPDAEDEEFNGDELTGKQEVLKGEDLEAALFPDEFIKPADDDDADEQEDEQEEDEFDFEDFNDEEAAVEKETSTAGGAKLKGRSAMALARKMNKKRRLDTEGVSAQNEGDDAGGQEKEHKDKKEKKDKKD